MRTVRPSRLSSVPPSGLLALPLVIWVGLGAHDAAACVCSPLAEEYSPAFGVDVPRSIRPLVVNPSGAPEGYSLLDLGPNPFEKVTDFGPSRSEEPSRPPDLGPVPPEARVVEISIRRLETRSERKTMALELAPIRLLASNHRFVVASSGRIRATFLTGEILDVTAPSPVPRLLKIQYPLPGGPRSFRTSCDTGSVSLVYVTGDGPSGAPRLYGIWRSDEPDSSPLAFSRTRAGHLELGHPGVCDAYGLSLEPGARVDLVLRERIGGGFGPPINVRINVPPG